MFSTSAQRLARTAIIRRGTALSAFAHPASSIIPMSAVSSTDIGRNFSTAPTESAFIEKPLKALDMAAVRQIKAELMAVDANFDGRSFFVVFGMLT
jgi:hypothetical protein